MSRWHNIYLDNHAHFCTYTVRNWQSRLAGAAVDCLYDEWRRNCERFSVKILAYVIMPDHVHMLIWSESGENIVRFMQRVLGQTSKRLKPGGGFWKERPRVFPVSSDDVIRQKMEYMHENPLRKKLVERLEDWPHSSYRQIVMGADDVAFPCDALD